MMALNYHARAAKEFIDANNTPGHISWSLDRHSLTFFIFLSSPEWKTYPRVFTQKRESTTRLDSPLREKVLREHLHLTA